jgi:hypothetical protein
MGKIVDKVVAGNQLKKFIAAPERNLSAAPLHSLSLMPP